MISVSSPSELRNRLRELDEPVPRRNEGRKSHHVETYSLVSWLLALDSMNRIEYPLVVKRRESPDYEVVEGGNKYGLELTEATEEGFAKALSMRDQEDPEALLDLSDPDQYASTSAKSIRRNIGKNEMTGPGWDGDEVEIYVPKSARHAVESKQDLLDSKYVNEYTNNKILVYALLPTPSACRETLADRLRAQFSDYWERDCRFRSVYLEMRGVMYEITERSVEFEVIPR